MTISARTGRRHLPPADGLTGLLISLEGEASEVVEIVELGTKRQSNKRRSDPCGCMG